MNVNLGITPFTDFWVDCMSNSQISILAAREPSFKYAAYLNDYQYTMAETKTNNQKTVRFLTVRFMAEVTSKYLYQYFSYEPLTFSDKKHGFEKIKELINQKKMIAVGVDLFYWIPKSFCYGKYHWEHYSLINGFDDQRKVLYVLDDNFNGFDCFEVPEERFSQAIGSLELNPDAFIVNVAQDLKPFELTLTEVMFFAEKLTRELGSIDAKNLLILSNPEIPIEVWFDLFAKYVYQVVNRQTANVLLFKALYDLNLIRDPHLISGLIQQANDLKRDWRILEQTIVKCYRLYPDRLNANQLYDQCNDLFHQEFEMWKRMLD